MNTPSNLPSSARMAKADPAAAIATSSSSAAIPPFRASNVLTRLNQSAALRLLLAALATVVGLVCRWPALAVPASLVLLALCLLQLLPDLWQLVADRMDEAPTVRVLSILGLLVAAVSLPLALGWWDPYLNLFRTRNWEAIGALGEGVIGAFGQILVALVALTIAWRQVLIDQRLTTQQHRITQAQHDDSFIPGIPHPHLA